MGYVAQLVKGNKIMKLDGTAGLKIGMDFTPPSTQFENIVGSGTSMNQYGGGTKFSDRAVNTSWTFSVRSLGTSNAICERQLDSLGYFLQQAGDPDEPLYFEYRPDSTFGFEPLWGQHGANRRIEIVAVDSRGLWDTYGLGQIRERVIFADIGLQIKPFALGKQQRVLTAGGGVLEDTIGLSNGHSKGVRVPPAATNKMTNPVFGHATWNNDWTAQANILATQNIDKNFILWGNSSARLHSIDAANITFYQTITLTAVNYTLSAYVKRIDGEAVTSNDCQLVYIVALATSFRSLGNGWYRATATVAGSAAAQAAGLLVKNGRTVFLAGMQAEIGDYFTPLCYGDMLGCSWAGTAHASASSRVVAKLFATTDDFLRNYEGTICVAVTMDHDSTFATNQFVWYMNGNNYAVYAAASNTWQMVFTSITAESSVQAFSAGQQFIFHFVFGPNEGLVIYINGVVDGTNATFTFGTPTANIYLGETDTPDQNLHGIFHGFTVYDHEMTQAEVTADYNNILPILTAGERIDWIPWLWTKDGDNVCDYYCDATHDSQAIVNGVPGDVDAKTVFQILSTVGGATAGAEILLSQGVYDSYVKQSASFIDLSGAADAAALGGEYITTAVTAGTPIVAGAASPMHIETNLDYYLGQNNRILFATRDHAASAAENLKADLYYDYGGLAFYDGKYKTIAADNVGIKVFYIGPSRFIDTPQKSYPWVIDSHITVYILLDRLSGTQDNHMDWFELFTGRFVHIKENGVRLANSSAILEGQKAYEVNSSGALTNHLPVVGDIIELTPKKYNMLTVWSGLIGLDQVLTNTSTFSRVYVTPRWITA